MEGAIQKYFYIMLKLGVKKIKKTPHIPLLQVL